MTHACLMCAQSEKQENKKLSSLVWKKNVTLFGRQGRCLIQQGCSRKEVEG